MTAPRNTEAVPVSQAWTPGPIMAGIERQIAHLRADPYEADAIPMDVISIADYAAVIDRQRAALASAVGRALAWHDRQGGHGSLPSEIEKQLRAALAKATGDRS